MKIKWDKEKATLAVGIENLKLQARFGLFFVLSGLGGITVTATGCKVQRIMSS